MDNSAKTGLSLNDDVGNTHLSTEGWEVDDQLDWIDIVCNDDQGGLLSFDEGNSVVETVLDEEGLLCFLRFKLDAGR